jgi:general nucleoside transport system permease protein
VSEPVANQPGPTPPPEIGEPGTLAARLALKQRAGGIAVPIATVFLAFLMGGLVVVATQHGGIGTRIRSTLTAYHQIFDGTGLNWLNQFFTHPCLHFVPCHVPTTNLVSSFAAYNLSQTLLQTTTLILTGLAVAFAFRCGMFNIGGQGQYFVGLIVANWLGVDFAGMATLPHILIAVGGATLAGAAWAGIAGVLKATVGAHEVISTIMLNWIAIWVATWIFGDGGPLQNSTQATVPVSNDVAHSAQLPTFWGPQGFQGVDIGLFIAIGALVFFWAFLNRTTAGYEVRAVGFNPDAAAYGGINGKKNLVRAMAISGGFAGLAGAVDMLGYLYHYGTLDVGTSQVGFLGIAVALLGRNTAGGTLFGALFFGALLFGTTHGLQGIAHPVVSAEAAGDFTYIIQGLVVLFVGADVLILYFWNSRKKLRPPRRVKPVRAPEAAA